MSVNLKKYLVPKSVSTEMQVLVHDPFRKRVDYSITAHLFVQPMQRTSDEAKRSCSAPVWFKKKKSL